MKIGKLKTVRYTVQMQFISEGDKSPWFDGPLFNTLKEARQHDKNVISKSTISRSRLAKLTTIYTREVLTK